MCERGFPFGGGSSWQAPTLREPAKRILLKGEDPPSLGGEGRKEEKQKQEREWADFGSLGQAFASNKSWSQKDLHTGHCIWAGDFRAGQVGSRGGPHKEGHVAATSRFVDTLRGGFVDDVA